MITLHCMLTFENEKNKQKLLKLMRKFSSCYRYAFNRLLEGMERRELKKHLQEVFGLNSRYCDDAILKASALIESAKARGQNPKKVVFGGRRLFEQIREKHLTGKRRDALRAKWEERRRGHLYSRGDRTRKGNLNTRLVLDEEGVKLRINTGRREWITANVKRKVTRENDKWKHFIVKIIEAERTGDYFPCSVEIRLINGKLYASMSYEEDLPPVTITKEEGIIGIDVNAKPFHIAMAMVDREGNLEGYKRVSLEHLINKTKNQREYLSWHIAKEIVEMGVSAHKAIAMEGLKAIPKGRRGDGLPRLRKVKQAWIYKGLLEKVKVLARRRGVEVRKVNHAYTSVIGMLKYAPQHSIDKDVAGAYVIGRRGLGYDEKVPENYLQLLKDKEFMEYALGRLDEEKEKTKTRIGAEKNPYKRKPLEKKVRELNVGIKLLQESPGGEPQAQQAANQRKERMRGSYQGNYKLWRVIRVALTFPVLGKALPRDLSPLKRILVSGAWDRVVGGLVPVSWDGGYGVDKYRLPGSCPHLKRRNTNNPVSNCSIVQFG